MHADFGVSTSLSLLERSLDGEADAWNRLDDIYSPMIYRWVRECGFQPNDARDLTQDVFVRVFRGLASFEQGPGRFRGWLWTITRNAIRDFIRQREWKPAAVESIQLEQLETPPWDAEASNLPPSEIAQRALRHLMDDFNGKTRTVVREVVMAERDPKEVAAELGISRNAVYIARSRALKKLRRLLEGTEFPRESTE